MMVVTMFPTMLVECVGAMQECQANCALGAKERMSGYPTDYHLCVTGQVMVFLG
jgi:hypothetical protein